MLVWKTILCAVDFSRASKVAMETAAALARRLEADLTLVHVSEPTMMTSAEVLAVTPPELVEAELAEIGRKLERWQEEAQRLAGRPVRTAVLSGQPAPEILRLLRNEPFDVAVLATRGNRGLKRVLLGSVAEQVVRTAPCPVVVARAPAGMEED